MKQFPEGLGLWIAFHRMALNRTPKEQKTALPASWWSVAAHMADMGVKWVAIRVPGELANIADGKKLVEKFGDYGISVYAWFYSYPSKYVREASLVRQYRENGFAGVIIDAEIEWTNKAGLQNNSLLATEYGKLVRADNPDYYVAHAPLAWQQYHKNWPYKEFGEWCDQVHPQFYWTELKNGLYDDMAKNCVPAWVNNPVIGKNLAPIGCTYGKGDIQTVNQPPGKMFIEDLEKWLRDTEDYFARSLYSYEAMTPAVEAVLKAYANVPKLAAMETGPTEDGSNE